MQIGYSGGVANENENAGPIDMRGIMQLAESDDTGAQFVTEIIDVFLTDLGERVRTIGERMSQGDRVGVAAGAHAIKGSCSHFGATRLMQLSRHVEEGARRKDEPLEGIEAAIESMIAETERVRAALEAFRRNNGLV
jgi:HPt (histidine-containing phosphotransfer) domain-containing protein